MYGVKEDGIHGRGQGILNRRMKGFGVVGAVEEVIVAVVVVGVGSLAMSNRDGW